MKPKNNNLEFAQHLAVLGSRDFFGLFAGRTERVEDAWRIPNNSPHKEQKWVKAEELENTISEYQRIRWSTWIYVNDIVPGHGYITSVKRIMTIFFDIDAPRKSKLHPATAEEQAVAFREARELQEYLKRKYGALCFAACSGNGAHVYCPVRPYEPPFRSQRELFNEKQRAWMRAIREDSGIKFDSIYNINRDAQPIGFYNMKIRDSPLPTYWLDKFKESDVVRARRVNRGLLEEIEKIRVSLERSVNMERASLEGFPQLLNERPWLRRAYFGDYDRKKYNSRSEIEFAIVLALVRFGYSDEQIREIMSGCQIGKWREEGESYRKISIKNARRIIEGGDKNGEK